MPLRLYFLIYRKEMMPLTSLGRKETSGDDGCKILGVSAYHYIFINAYYVLSSL